MDSAGLGLIMNYYVSAQDHGRKLLLAGVNERITALFEMTKVQGVLRAFRLSRRRRRACKSALVLDDGRLSFGCTLD